MNEVIPLIPILYVLYIHRQTFKRDIRSASRSATVERLDTKPTIEEGESVDITSNTRSKVSSNKPSASNAFIYNRLQETGALTSSQGRSSPIVTVRTESITVNSDPADVEEINLIDKSGFSTSVRIPEASCHDYEALLDTIQGY